jgi:hypothetical protein
MAALLHRRFDALPRRLVIDALTLFVEDEPGADFRVYGERRLDGDGLFPTAP